MCGAFITVAVNKKAQLMLAYPRDAKTMKKFLHFEVITSASQVGNPVFIVIKFLIQILQVRTIIVSTV